MNILAQAFHYIVFILGFSAISILYVIRRRMRTQSPAAVSLPHGVRIGNGQTIGKRQEQDDYFASATTSVGTFAVVADGISGLQHGRMASTLAVATFMKEFLQVDKQQDILRFLERSSQRSNRDIVEQLHGSQGGTTLVAAVISQGYLYWGAVGDSLLMIYRNRSFQTVNMKDTLEQVLEERYLKGDMSREELDESPVKHQLINYLGYESFQSMEIGEPLELQPGDKLLLCSDGILDALTEIELEALLERHDDLQDAADAIIEAVEAKQLRHQDNATIVLLEASSGKESE